MHSDDAEFADVPATPIEFGGQDVDVVALSFERDRLHRRPKHFEQLLGTPIDVTDRRLVEESRTRAAAEHAARQVAEATAARLRAILGGVAAIVWEADAQTWECTFVSDHAEELLGYPVSRWVGNAEFWQSVVHPDDRDEMARVCRESTAAGLDYDLHYRMIAEDGRVLWMHDVVPLPGQYRRPGACPHRAPAGRHSARPGIPRTRRSDSRAQWPATRLDRPTRVPPGCPRRAGVRIPAAGARIGGGIPGSRRRHRDRDGSPIRDLAHRGPGPARIAAREHQ